jgi:hypothetical protein
MFKVERSKVAISLYGKEYEILKPTYGQSLALQDRLKLDENKDKGMQIMKEFVISLGLPEEALLDIELDHFVQLIEYISGIKKN